MTEVSITRLNVLRAMYLFMALGLLVNFWPSILFPPDLTAGPKSVIRALLGALALISLLGLRYPLQLIPILLFELLWKIIWVVASAWPMWAGPGLDTYASETLFACLMGIILVPLALPWDYVFQQYLRASGSRWRKAAEPTSKAA